MINLEIAKSKQANTEYSAYLTTEQYDAEVVDVVRALPSRWYNKDNKCWEVPLNKVPTLLDKLAHKDFSITGQYVDLTEKKEELPEGFEFKTNPYSYQLDGVLYGLSHDCFLLGDDQGLGKTKQAIDLAVANKIKHGCKHCLIICGVNSVKWNWIKEIEVHSNEHGYILGQRLRKKSNKMYIGSTADKLYDLKHVKELSQYFIVTNIETLRDKDIATEISKLCKNNTISMCIVDEHHKAANTTSQQGKGLMKVQPQFRVSMTGTPIQNKPIDAYGVLKWLGYEKHTLSSFKNHHCQYGGFGGHEIIGYKNLDELQETIDGVMLRRLKDKVLDLPDKVIVTDYLEMSTKQEKIYKQCLDEVQSDIDKVKKAVNPLSELLRLRQATAYTGILSTTVNESVKFERLIEILDDAIDNNDCVVSFTQWTSVSKPLVDFLNEKGYKVATITGETKDIDRQQIVDNFQNGEYDILVGTVGAMGTGLTLTKSHTEVFMDVPWTYANFAQAVDRCYRIGQNHKVTVHNLVCKDTIDEKIWNIVQKKGKMSDMLIDGEADSSNVNELINSLLD